MRPPGVEGHLPHMLTRGIARACTCSYARAGPARDNAAWAGRALEADQNTVVCVLVDCCKITCGCIKQYTV